MSFKWQNIWSKQYQTPQLPAACCTAQQIGSLTVAPCRSSNYYASHCCLLTLELNRRQDEKRAEKRNEKAEEAKEKQIMKWENDVERVHKPEVKKGIKRDKKKGTGQKKSNYVKHANCCGCRGRSSSDWIQAADSKE